MSNTKTTQLFRATEGKKYQIGRIAMSFKRTDDEDEGSYSLFETTEPMGAGAGIHRHPGFQETFIVLEGTFTFEVDDVSHDLGVGDVIVVTRGAWHGFRCTAATGALADDQQPGPRLRSRHRRGLRGERRYRVAGRRCRSRHARDRGASRTRVPLAAG